MAGITKAVVWAPPKRKFRNSILFQEGKIAGKTRGYTNGLKSSQLKRLQRLYQRRFPEASPFSKEQARELSDLSRDIGRQIGILIERRGRPVMVIVGRSHQITIPDLGRQRYSPGRLRGLRLLHTHLDGSGLSNEDLMDMVFLRLDSIGVLIVSDSADTAKFQWASLLPPNPEKRLYHVSAIQPCDNPDMNFPFDIDALEAEFLRKTGDAAESKTKEKAVLISADTRPRHAQHASLTELAELARNAGLEIGDTMIQRIEKPESNPILRQGKLAELEVMALQNNASVLVFDRELTPAQIRNLAETTERKILDRTQVILDIFAQHATSKAGKQQVELAQLAYTLPRLVGRNRALSRLAGGIGGRGPGETKLELDRRRIRDRMTKIKKSLSTLRKQREDTRQRRNTAGLPIVSLVGYTNAGKSTLLNTLTKSTVKTADQLFATLDPTSRRLKFPREQEIILTDTVGFIRHLPEKLKEAFMATLEELGAADILLHVADASHADVEDQVEAVHNILDGMGLNQRVMLMVLNKWDKVEKGDKTRLRNIFPEAVPISALDIGTLGPLTKKIRDECRAMK